MEVATHGLTRVEPGLRDYMLAVVWQARFQSIDLLGYPFRPKRRLGGEQLLEPRCPLPVNPEIFPNQLFCRELTSRINALQLEVGVQVDPRVNILAWLIPRLIGVRLAQEPAQPLEEMVLVQDSDRPS